MRNLWIGSLLVLLSFSLSASEAAQEEPDGPELKVLSSEATYVGPLLDDRAVQQRVARQRELGTGAIDVYNVWTSYQKVKLKSNLTIVGHSYQICQQDSRLVFATLIWSGTGGIEVRVQHTLNRGGGTFTCDFDVTVFDFWLLTCEIDARDVRPGFYKVTSKHTVTRGGSGGGKETAWFDVFDCS